MQQKLDVKEHEPKKKFIIDEKKENFAVEEQ